MNRACMFSIIFISTAVFGVQITDPYSIVDLTNVLYSVVKVSISLIGRQYLMMSPNFLYDLLTVFCICGPHVRSFFIVIPRSLIWLTSFVIWLFILYSYSILFCLLVNEILKHLSG
uniref:Uncharacterized protein n=1 Tax=Cacopsylla melanoneura TaxID=428564 RepID=A0A8D8SPB1_9HEMI